MALPRACFSNPSAARRSFVPLVFDFRNQYRVRQVIVVTGLHIQEASVRSDIASVEVVVKINLGVILPKCLDNIAQSPRFFMNEVHTRKFYIQMLGYLVQCFDKVSFLLFCSSVDYRSCSLRSQLVPACHDVVTSFRLGTVAQ